MTGVGKRTRSKTLGRGAKPAKSGPAKKRGRKGQTNLRAESDDDETAYNNNTSDPGSESDDSIGGKGKSNGGRENPTAEG